MAGRNNVEWPGPHAPHHSDPGAPRTGSLTPSTNCLPIAGHANPMRGQPTITLSRGPPTSKAPRAGTNDAGTPPPAPPAETPPPEGRPAPPLDSPSPQRDTGRIRRRKQPNPQHVTINTVRPHRRAQAQRRPLTPRPPTRGDAPSPHPPDRPAMGPPPPPSRPPPASVPPPVPTIPTPPPPHSRYLARACKARETAAPPQRQYNHTLTRGGGIRLGLGLSDIPHAGWGVFALTTIKVGATVLDYSGPPRTKEWVENPLNDTRYVWGDENEAEALAAQGRLPIYVDANPAVSTSWGGRVNDGFHRGAHLRAERVRGSDRVILRAIAPAAADEELYLEYGGDYWQAHYHSLPPSVQAEARAHYDLTVIAGTCYTAEQRRQAASEGRIHCVKKSWYEGPPPTPPSKRPPQARPPPRLPPAPLYQSLTRDLGPADDPPCGAHHRSDYTQPPAGPGSTPSPPPTPPPAPRAPWHPAEATPAAHERSNEPTPLLNSTTDGTPPPPATTRAPPTPPVAIRDTQPLDWTTIRGSTISGCVCLGWADTPATRVALEALICAGNAALGPLYALATLPHSPLAFRLWRATPGPRAPWFHEGALDGIVADYMMKTRAASGLRSPSHHGTLSLQDPTDRHLLAGHCRALGLLPQDLQPPTPGPEEDYWQPVHHMSPPTLLPLQSTALPYTCFTATEPPESRQGTWGLCYSDSRLPQTGAFTWDDLQTLGNQPNYCRHDDRGFSPITVEVPENEVERMRWGIHSLCQHTMEAILLHTQGPPPPTWRRGRNRLGQPAFVQTGPPDSTHLGPPLRPPPPPRETGPPTPYKGLPEGCPWLPDDWCSHALHNTVIGERGPYSLAFHGTAAADEPDITVASLNINGLTAAKLTEALWLMQHTTLDVLVLVDVRCSHRQLKFLAKTARDCMGLGSWTHASPARNLTGTEGARRHEMVGGQLILITPRWGGAVRAAHADPTGLGILTEVTLGATGGDIQLLGTYFPCPTTAGTGLSNKLWDKTQAWLNVQGIHKSPQTYLQDTIQGRVLRHLGRGATSSPPRRNIALVGGDFNSTWEGHHGPLRGLGGWAAQSSLLSPIAALDPPEPLHSYYMGGAPKSLIDHILLTQPCQGRILRAGLYDGSFFGSLTDHRPIVLGLKLWATAGPTFTTNHTLQRPAVRGPELDLMNPELIRDYQAYLLTTLPPEPPQGHTASDALLHLSQASAAWTATRLARHRPPTRKRTHFNGWSPEAMALKANLSAVIQIQGNLRGYRGHSHWRRQDDMDRDLPGILQQWREVVTRLRWPSPEDPHRIMDCSGMGPTGWSTTTLLAIQHPHRCAALITKLKRVLHGRQRTLLRQRISSHTAHLETLRITGRIGRVIKSTLQEDVELFTLESLPVPGEGILTDHRAIHNLVTAHFTQWYKGPEGPEVPWATISHDQHCFLAHTASRGIPTDLGHLLWQALTNIPGVEHVRADLARELATPPSLGEFNGIIAGHRGSTTPGATGLTYNMVKGWPAPVRTFSHRCLVELWGQPDTPPWLQWGWLCPKPKDPEAAVTLDGLRPLILLEVIRKLWVGLIIGRITRAWERHGVLADAQHGFRPGRGTDTALIQFINAREHAEEAALPLYSSSWDIRRAFDSVPRGAMEISWTRLGVPADIARWLATMDVGGPTVIRSPWALQTWARSAAQGFGPTPSLDRPCTFHRDRGTPQGDVSSPHNWVGFFDIALHALQLDRQTPNTINIGSTFQAPGTHGVPYLVGDMGYADDLVSTASTLPGLQRQADIISAFALCFDMEISVTKLRLARFSGPRPPPLAAQADPEALIIHGRDWSPQQVEVKGDGTVKMLGMTFDIRGPQRTQAQATKLRLARASTIMCAQRAVDNAVLTASVSSLTRASYTAQFTDWSANDLTELDTTLNRLFRRASNNMPTFPTRLLYLPTSHGGMGLPRLSTYVNLRKWSMAQRAMSQDNNTAHAVHGLMDRAARASGCTGTSASIGYTALSPTWGGSLGHHCSGTHPIVPQKGLYHSVLDVPLSLLLDSRPQRRCLATLQNRNLLTWGDLSWHELGQPRQWLPPHVITQLLTFPTTPPGECPTDEHHSLHAGQFWMLRGTATAKGGLFQVLIAPTPSTHSITLQRWVGTEHRTWRPTPTVGQRIHPAGRTVQLHGPDFAARSHRRVIVHLLPKNQVGTILTHFSDSFQVTTPTRAHWADKLRPHLDPTKHWRIYANGSWKASATPHHDHYFSLGDSHSGGGSLVIMASEEDWANHPILVLPFTAEDLDPSQGGSPNLMELLAITGGLQILSHLNLSGTVLSDCQGLVRKIGQRHVLRRTPTNAGYPLLRDCVRSLTPHRTIQWIKGHPERSRTPRSGWTQDQWGNYMADLFAGDPTSTPPIDFPHLLIHSALTHAAIAQASIRPTDWHFIAPGQAPLLGGLRQALANASLLDYTQTRDTSRATRGAAARWEGASVHLAAQAWNLSHRGVAKRGAKVRHLWDLRWHGENQAVANPDMADTLGRCPLCGHPNCSQTHILCTCPGLSAERTGLAQDLTLIVHRLHPGPGRSLGRAVLHLLFHHRDIAHRGHLWTGLWTPQQRALLGPHLRRCRLKDGQRILLQLSTWAASQVPTLWAQFQEHVDALVPLPTLSTTLPHAHTEYPAPAASDMATLPPDTPDRPVRDTPPPPQAPETRPSPPPNHPLARWGRYQPPPPRRRDPRLTPRPRSPPAAPESPAPHGRTWPARITDDDMSSAPVPRWTTLSNPGACSNAQRGGSLLV